MKLITRKVVPSTIGNLWSTLHRDINNHTFDYGLDYIWTPIKETTKNECRMLISSSIWDKHGKY